MTGSWGTPCFWLTANDRMWYRDSLVLWQLMTGWGSLALWMTSDDRELGNPVVWLTADDRAW